MIIKRTIGVSASKALAYDYGPGRAQEHHRPHRVAGTCVGSDWRARAARMDARLREHGDNTPGSKGRVIRLAVACAPEDRVLTDRQWARIAHQTVDGYTKGRADEFTWEAVRHDARHIHVTLLQRDHDAKLLNLWQDGRRRMHLETALEKEHGLRGPVSERAKALDRSRSRDAIDRRTWKNAKTMQQVRGTLAQQQDREQYERTADADRESGAARPFGVFNMVGGAIAEFTESRGIDHGEYTRTGKQRRPYETGCVKKSMSGSPTSAEPAQEEPEQQHQHDQRADSGRFLDVFAAEMLPATHDSQQSHPHDHDVSHQKPANALSGEHDRSEPERAADHAEPGDPHLETATDRAYWKALQPLLSLDERHVVARDGLTAAPDHARTRAVAQMARQQTQHRQHQQQPTRDHQGRDNARENTAPKQTPRDTPQPDQPDQRGQRLSGIAHWEQQLDQWEREDTAYQQRITDITGDGSDREPTSPAQNSTYERLVEAANKRTHDTHRSAEQKLAREHAARERETAHQPDQAQAGRDWDQDRPTPQEFKAMSRQQQQAIVRQIAEQRRAEQHHQQRDRDRGRDDNRDLER